MSAKGQIPFVELNGKQIADSNLIIEYLTAEYSVNLDDGLSIREIADCRAYHSLIEDTIRWQMIYFRSKNNDFFVTSDGFLNHFSPVKQFFFKCFINSKMRKKMKSVASAQGVGRHTVEEVEKMCKDDLKAVATFLGDRPYMFGDSPTTLDATAFGHLAQLYYAPLLDGKIKTFMDEETPNLTVYLKRLKERYWPDWDEATKNLSLTTKPENPESPET